MKDKENKSIENKEKTKSSFFRNFRRRWLTSKIDTLLLIAILVVVFILINLGVRLWNPTAIDCTTSQDYTLTDESKERVKNIDKEIKIYFVGFSVNDKVYTLSEQYHKANSKINLEIVDVNQNVEFAKKYDVTNESETIIVESGKAYRKLEAYDLYTYDSNYNTIDISEQKITSAILNVTSEKSSKIYFLEGYTDLSLKDGLKYLSEYLDNEVLEYEELNILTEKEVPDDCDTLVIMTPTKDFDEVTTNEIIKYITKGGNILWFNGVLTVSPNYKNVNRLLAQYGIKPFEKGLVYETNSNNIVLGYSSCFMPEIEDSEILKDVKNGMGTIFFNATKINVDEDKFDSLKVEKTDLITSSDTTYFAKDLTAEPDKSKDEKGGFILGAQFVKIIQDNTAEEGEEDNSVKSTLILFGNDYFISDFKVQYGQYQIPVIDLANNKDVALNSIAYLTNNDQDITIRKSYTDSQTTFTPTEKQLVVIRIVIFAVPVVIMLAGVIIWVIRKRRK